MSKVINVLSIEDCMCVHPGLSVTPDVSRTWHTYSTSFNIHVPSPSQGADKTQKGPNGLSAFEAAENEAIKALLE